MCMHLHKYICKLPHYEWRLSMGLTACSEAPAVTPKERQGIMPIYLALLRLEMAFVKGLKAEKMIQQKYRSNELFM